MSSKCAAQHGYAYKVNFAGYSFWNGSSIIHKIAFVWISTLESLVFTCTATQWAHPAHEIYHRSGGEGGRGDGVSKGISGSIGLPVWRHVSRRWLSKWRTKCSSKRRIKISNLSRQYCSDFLDLEILRALSVIEKQTLVLFWSETSSGVMNFKISFYRLANFTGNQTSLGPVHSKMKECWHSNRRFIKWKNI